jgi:hypothetical protein
MNVLQLLNRAATAAPLLCDAQARFDRVREQLPVAALLLLRGAPALAQSGAALHLIASLCELLAAAEANRWAGVSVSNQATQCIPAVVMATRIDQQVFTRETVCHFVAVKHLAARLRRSEKQVERLRREVHDAAQQLEDQMRREIFRCCATDSCHESVEQVARSDASHHVGNADAAIEADLVEGLNTAERRSSRQQSGCSPRYKPNITRWASAPPAEAGSDLEDLNVYVRPVLAADRAAARPEMHKAEQRWRLTHDVDQHR